jgi:hypothetical protein
MISRLSCSAFAAASLFFNNIWGTLFNFLCRILLFFNNIRVTLFNFRCHILVFLRYPSYPVWYLLSHPCSLTISVLPCSTSAATSLLSEDIRFTLFGICCRILVFLRYPFYPVRLPLPYPCYLRISVLLCSAFAVASLFSYDIRFTLFDFRCHIFVL